jgi:transcription elongation factor Elf1
MPKNLRVPKASLERRSVRRCPFCNSANVHRETTLKAQDVTMVWRCSPCGKTWPERRHSAA